jgi:hypothetical protein
MQKWVFKVTLAFALVWPAGATLLRAQTAEAEQRAAEEVRAEQQRQDEIRQRAELELHRAPLAQGQLKATARAMVARTKTEKAAWLGVRTSHVPGVIRMHLKNRNKYAGLLVEHVEPESPASEAGLQQYDIIEKVGDQWIVNKEQFGAVLRMQKIGDPVTLAIVREGETTEVTAKLIEKDLPVLALGGVSQIEMVEVPFEGNVLNIAPQGQFLIRDGKLDVPLQKWRQELNSELKFEYPEHTLTVITTNGNRHLRATDKAGTVLFDGPIDTEEDLAKVPNELRDKLPRITPGDAELSRPAPATGPAAPRQR